MSCPANILAYFRSQPNEFEVRKRSPFKFVYILLSVVCIVLLIFPQIIDSDSVSFVRFIAAIALIVFGLLSLFDRTQYYSRKSGGRIEGPRIKMFDLSEISEKEVIDLFNRKDFVALFNLPNKSNSNLQLSVFNDPQGHYLYCQLRKYFPSSDFEGITDVATITEPQYSQVNKLI